MSILHTYFTSIHTDEILYILGLIIFNIKKNTENKIIIEIKLNNVRDLKNNSYLSYNSYINTTEKYNYTYYKNIDRVVEILNNLGDIQYKPNNIIKLTITSIQIIKDIFSKHLDLYLVNTKYYDLSLFMNTIYNTNSKLLNNFIKAYIENNGILLNNSLYIKVYNYNTLAKIVELYKTPYQIIRDNLDSDENVVYTLKYKNSNMIDFLGQIYENTTDLYINDYLRNFMNSNNNEFPVLKIIKVDKDAIIPSKTNYSDAGLDLSIIKESKCLNSDTILYDTGIKLEIPNGYYVEIVSRSSISKSGYMLANNIGIIDQGYTGNLYVALRKINKDCENLVFPYKCCQIIMKKQIFPKIIIYDDTIISYNIEDVNDTSRGKGGFGSTDN